MHALLACTNYTYESAHTQVAVPEDISDEAAACMSVNPLTVIGGLFLACHHITLQLNTFPAVTAPACGSVA